LKPFLVALACCWLTANQLLAANPDYSTVPLDRLVDDLALIDSFAPGITSTAMYQSFIAVDEPPEFAWGILGTPTPNVPPQMRELVRRGVGALPTLIQHLNDARSTRLSVGGSFFMFQLFAEEYDPRNRPAVAVSWGTGLFENGRTFRGAYQVKIGDICYVLVGQIVNRQLNAVRYQPSAGLVVNSPVETPSLIEKIKKDWGDLDTQAHERSLLEDVRANNTVSGFSSSLKRLRFYYPAAYTALHDDDANKRHAFEAKEKLREAPK
jgi:hypothetical protein